MHNISRRGILALGCSAAAWSGTGANAAPDIYSTERVVVGDATGTPITLTTLVHGPGPRFVNLHENERTSVEAVRSQIENKGGIFLGLSQHGKRTIEFSIKGEQFVADPNRIFTEKGVTATLGSLSKRTPAAERALANLGELIVRKIGCHTAPLVVALHNNTEGSLSIESYASDKPFRQGVSAVTRVKENDPDDFFYVTEKSHYQYLAEKGFNVALQNAKAVTDDGSLSVYCARRGIPYVNIEAQHGHEEVQRTMVAAVYDMVRAS